MLITDLPRAKQNGFHLASCEFCPFGELINEVTGAGYSLVWYVLKQLSPSVSVHLNTGGYSPPLQLIIVNYLGLMSSVR